MATDALQLLGEPHLGATSPAGPAERGATAATDAVLLCWLNVARVGVCWLAAQASGSRMKACWRSSLADGRSVCSISNVCSRKSSASVEMSSGTVGRLDEPICSGEEGQLDAQ